MANTGYCKNCARWIWLWDVPLSQTVCPICTQQLTRDRDVARADSYRVGSFDVTRRGDPRRAA